MINLYLDDMRQPYDGWTLVKTIEEAKALLKLGVVDQMSLDHDLGACDTCLEQFEPRNGRPYDEWVMACQNRWLTETNFSSMPHCEHFGSGYELCLWMAEHGIWSKQRPHVHSANPAGRERMWGVINRYFGTTPENGWQRLETANT
jgi:hypothetical protein